MRTPWPEGGCHQCWTSPSTNWRAAARSRCSRASSRPRDHERHHVLELVAESVGAARLVEGGARPDAAGERLVEQPAVEQQVHGAVRRRHLDGAEHVVPLGRDVRQRERRRPRRDSGRRARARPPACRPGRAGRRPRPGRRRRSSITVWSAAHGSRPAPTRPDGAPRAPAPRDGRACRCGRGTRCGRRSTRSGGRRGRRTRRGPRTRRSRRCARGAPRSPRRSR